MDQIFWIYRDELAGRPGPGVAPWSLSKLKAAGIDVMLSLASDLFPHSEAVAAGIPRTCIPFPDVLPPDAHVVSLCRANLLITFEFISSNIDSGRSVLVHCAGGYDRTGLVLAHYMARREKMTASEAIEKLRAIRAHALSADGWEDMARDLIRDAIGESAPHAAL